MNWQEQEATIRKAYNGLKVLVTGGCGFIGSHLAAALAAAGADVTALDLVTRDLGSGVRVLQADVLDRPALERAMADNEVVFHLAGLLGVERILHMPLEVLEVNLRGVVNALEAAHRNAVRRFVFTSSSEVYGEPQRVPIAESDPKAPVSTYGVAKLAAEAYCEAYRIKYGLPTTCVRYFNVFGPGQAEKFVIPIFISLVEHNQPPVIYGDGEQVRSYAYIDDIVRGTLLAGASGGAVGETFNLGNDRPVAIKDLAQFIVQYYASDLKPVYRYFGEGIRVESREIKRRIPDITKARLVLGYEPQIPFEAGIERYIQWYKEARRSAGGGKT